MDRRVDSMTLGRRWRFLQQYPCMSDEMMDVTTTAPVTLQNLAMPRLRKCPFDIDTIDWKRARLLGAGTDGCVYRVHFGDQGQFALKLFWIPDLVPEYPEYSAVHRECQNAALLQLLRASMDQTSETSAAAVPPLVSPNPMDFLAASDNLFSFSEELRRAQQQRAAMNKPPPPDLVPVTSMPRFAQCYGWLSCNVHELIDKMPRLIRSYGFHADRKTHRQFDQTRSDFIGIVYEYIRSDDSDDSDASESGEASSSKGQQCQMTSPNERTTARDARRYNTRSSTDQTKYEAAKKAEKHASDTAEAKQALHSEHATQAAKAEKDARDRERVSAVADFLWLAGFDFCNQPLARNWKNGVLVDHSEIIGPYSPGWQRGPRNTKLPVDKLLTPSE